MTLPVGECTYVYLGLTAGRGYLGSNFSLDDHLANVGGGSAALLGRSTNPNGSVNGSTGPYSVIDGMGLNAALAVAGESANASLTQSLALSFSVPTFALLVGVERNVSSLAGISAPFQEVGPWGGPVRAGTVLGGFATALLSPGTYTVTVDFSMSTGRSAGILVVYATPVALMDWESVPMQVAGGTPPGWGGEGSRFAIDPAAGEAVLFGGESAQGLSATTLILNLSNRSWVPLPRGAVAPSPRANFSFTADPARGVAVLFGGVVNLTTNACDNSTWLYYFGQHRWQNLNGIVGAPPPPREGAATAADLAASVLVLEGGSDPGFPVTGGVASVLWNDTWAFNLSSPHWYPLGLVRGPPPRTDAVLTFVPPLREFLLLGGCARQCSATGWQLSYPFGDWSPWAAASGPVIPGLGGSAWVWDSVDQAAILFGGYRLLSGTMFPLNETFAWYAANSTWTSVASPDAIPSARFGSAADFVAAGPCPGMLVLGGSPVASGEAPSLFALDSNLLPERTAPPTAGLCGVEPKLRIPSGPDFGNLSVHVRGLRGGPLNAALVWVSSNLGLVAQTRSDAYGWANFTHLPVGALGVNGSLPGYANNTTRATVLGGTTVAANLTLVRAGTLEVDVYGVSYLNLVQYPIPGAFVQVSLLSNPSTGVSSYTNPTGTAALLVPAGWYSLFVQAYGFQPNVPPPPSQIQQIVLVPESAVHSVTVVLQTVPGPDVTVTVLDIHTLRAIPSANLTLSISIPDGPLYYLGLWHVGTAGSFVWFQVPPAVYSIEAIAPGYVTNGTSASLHVNSPPVFLTIYLTRSTDLVVPCGSLLVPCNQGGTPGGGIEAPFGARLVVGSLQFWSLVLVPLLLVGLVLAEVLWLRRRRETAGATGRTPPAATPRRP
ncbi:MAG: hypothetical protein L3K15_08620 [Thermoplasmata archaeon]|nr:hypothetical protein [Thermoplasmata archaeon]